MNARIAAGMKSPFFETLNRNKGIVWHRKSKTLYMNI